MTIQRQKRANFSPALGAMFRRCRLGKEELNRDLPEQFIADGAKMV